MFIETVAPGYQQSVTNNEDLDYSDLGSLFESILADEADSLVSAQTLEPNPMPQPIEGQGGEATIEPRPQPVEDGFPALQPLTALLAMAGSEDWTYNREELMSEVDTFLSALGVDHHDILEFTEMFPPEGAELDLVRMGRLVTKAGDILAGRVDASKLAELLPESGMSEAQVQSWLTAMGVEYQRTGELMKADGEAGGEFNSSVVEENLVANLVNTLPEDVDISDIAGLLAATVGESALYAAFGSLLGDLA